ncbi:MAG: protein kinase [Anaerolineae bacterium]|nr:protein kinase [Anaerolineae bacterium]
MPEQALVSPNSMIASYRITELIGKGGFSEVWSAWDTRLNRLVAIKVIPRVGSDAHSTIQFGREASVITRLEHPNILPLYDFGETPQYRYLVMRYVTGGSLADRVERARLPIHEVLRLMLPVASTLDYIHAQRVVHRDLKPGNILLDAQNAPYLADFGLSKELTDETSPMHSASGTLTYMPPEQFSGGILSPRSDLYSFGILLYQLLAGELPYKGQVALGMRQLGQKDTLPDITLVEPKLPAKLNDYLRQLTDPNPDLRPENATEVMWHIAGLLQNVEGGQSATGITADLSLALESADYRLREAESLLQRNLAPWENGAFTLSLTHFVLLDILLRDLPSLLASAVRSLMLRGALEYNRQIDYWWEISSDSERQRACWHAVIFGETAVSLHALALAVHTLWVRNASEEAINNVGKRLMPISEFTPTALEFLERSLPDKTDWPAAPGTNGLVQTDDTLAALATSSSPLADRAAALIGKAKRTRAMLALPMANAHPRLVAYEAAGSLPDGVPTAERLRLLALLAVRQLTRNPALLFAHWRWAALGNVLAMALMIYVVWRSADLLGSARLLNTLGLGLMFGLIFSIGVWLARHIPENLRIIPLWLRTILGISMGGLVMTLGFDLFQRLVYNDVIEAWVAITSGVLYVLGFAISVTLPAWVQTILGAAGVAAAFLIPWAEYLTNDVRPPFVFDEYHPEIAAPLVLVAAALMAVLTLGYVWRRLLRPKNSIKPQPASSPTG